MTSGSHLDYVDVDGESVASLDRGSGPPLMLVHGYFLSSRTWRRAVPLLASDYRFIAVDLLGAGLSRPGSGRDLSIPGQAKMLLGLTVSQRVEVAAAIAHPKVREQPCAANTGRI